MKNIVVWFIGGNAVGKTTLALALHKHLKSLSESQHDPILVEKKLNDIKYKYTIFSEYSSNLGDLTSTQCGGTDTLSTKEQIILALKECKMVTPVVVAEGIMATGQWINFLKDKDTFVLLVHLRLSLKEDVKRLKKRRSEKKGIPIEEVVITENTMSNIQGKLNGFESLYQRMKPLCDHSIQLDASKFIFDVTDTLVKQFNKVVETNF